MKRYTDIENHRFGKLTAKNYVGSDKYGNAYWRVVCDCGVSKRIRASLMITGKQESCGCLFREERRKRMREKQLIHGMSKTKPYNVWCNMIARCKRKTHRRYGDWGGRGIGVCEEWLKFENFWNDMKDGYSDGLSIDRIDNDGDYNLKNCRWATAKQQANNTRKTKKGQ